MALVVMLGTLMASGAHAGTDVPPQRKRALLAWLKAGTYQSAFTPEPEPHTSDGTNDAVSFGRGLAVCTGCHRGGIDYLRSTFRP